MCANLRSNVDRLWAIWQALNPDSFMSPRPAPYSTFSVTSGASQSKDTPLAPFWDKSGTKFWTSAQIKDTAATFGYAYPETQSWKFSTVAEYQADIRQTVGALYGTNVFANFVANVAQRKQEHDDAVNALAVHAKADGVKDAGVDGTAVKEAAVKEAVVKGAAVAPEAGQQALFAVPPQSAFAAMSVSAKPPPAKKKEEGKSPHIPGLQSTP